ncbi:hypothetical protein AbraIFM66950_005392 [Aspergillus brasiliensis]|nr:hypothetical protein AbraIFM66950_005392 [Aspergillus brasiliensis]
MANDRSQSSKYSHTTSRHHSTPSSTSPAPGGMLSFEEEPGSDWKPLSRASYHRDAGDRSGSKHTTSTATMADCCLCSGLWLHATAFWCCYGYTGLSSREIIRWVVPDCQRCRRRFTTSVHLITLRALAGLSASYCLPGAVGIAARVFPASSSPRRRSLAFAAMGSGQAVGFGLGLVIGGIFSDTVGWRWGFYDTAIINSAVLALALRALPHGLDGGPLSQRTLTHLARGAAWIGALLISTCLALLSYQLAVVTQPGADSIMRQPVHITILCVAGALLPAFGLWMHRQTRRHLPALIPNSIWSNRAFITICITVFFVWDTLNASEQLTALYL